jgi:hypothetical protein
MRRTSPISDRWGFDRGTPIDRYLIENFLDECRADISGDCLEIKDTGYTTQFGSNVRSADVLDIDPSNPHATIVSDLADTASVEPERFDCFIVTQTLQFVYDLGAATRTAHLLLRPGGVLLLTVPAVSRIDRAIGVDGEFWRFTAAGCDALLGEIFGPANVHVRSYGNVLTAVSFLMGLAAEDLSRRELHYHDEFFPVLIGARAVKA